LPRFNYSNHPIIERSKFHGLRELQGKQTTSDVRSLNTELGTPGPTCGLWNSPYEPGPVIDSADIRSWTCGAALQNAFNNDAESLPYVFSNGVNKQLVSPDGSLNLREIPIGLQLFDWKHWLPRIHPKDAWGDYLTNANLNKRYSGVLRCEFPVSIASAVEPQIRIVYRASANRLATCVWLVE
jgi:hypothetical protein